MTSNVHVLATGGTIASTAGADGAEPTERGAALVESVPGLSDLAALTVRQVAQTPSYELEFGTLVDLVGAVRSVVADGADGVVVTHGTDTMAESAYVTRLTADVDAPVVFTGAQRRPDEPSPDGPANLLTAVRAASDDRLGGFGGTYLAFDGRVHAARSVEKVHTSRLDAFASPDAGPVASATHGGLRVHREPDPPERTYEPSVPDATVRLVTSAVGVPGAPVVEAVEAGVDGVVVAATGLGNVTAGLAEGVAGAVDTGVPVVVASRCLGGGTAPVYGGAGGGETLRRHGARFAGALSAPKARLRLLLALSAAEDPAPEALDW